MATGGTVTFDFKGNTKDLDSKINKIPNTVGQVGNTVKSIIAGLGITQMITSAMSAIENSIESAVSRVDTMNNFPRVMENMKISSQDSKKAINKLSDALTGLPTTLDSATMAVQRLVTKNGDVEKSTDLFLAMNNAVLAGGASMEVQSSALEQMSQAYAKGKPDMVEWRSMLNAMPAQLKQVSIALGYDTVDAMGEALRATDNTDFTMNELLDTMVKLNTEGVDGFASFEQQARSATGGIGTSITNMHTAITRGVANVISSIDELLSENGLGGIANVIQETTKYINEFFNLVSNNVPLIVSSMSSIAPAILGLTGGFAILEKINLPGLASETSSVFDLLGKSVKPLGDLGKEAGLNLAVGFDTLSSKTKNIPIIGNALSGLNSKLSNLTLGGAGLLENFNNKFGDVIGKIVGATGKVLPAITKAFSIGAIIGTVIAGLGLLEKNFGSQIDNIIKNVSEKAPQIIETLVSKITDISSQIPNLIKMGVDLIQQISNIIIENAPMLLNASIQMIVELANGLAQQLPTLIPTVISLLMLIVNALVDNLDLILNAGINIIIGLIEGITNAIPQIIETIPKIITTLVDTLTNPEMLTKLISAALDLIIALAEGLIDALPALIEAIPTIILNIVTALTSPEMINKLGQTALKLVEALTFGLIKSIPSLVKGIGQLGVAIAKGFAGFVTGIPTVGLNMIKGLWEGLKDAKQWLLDKIAGLGGSILKGIKGVLGIHSPSTEFAWVGKMSAEGYVEGLDDMSNDIQDQLNTSFGLNPNVVANAGMNFSPVVNTTVVVNNETDPLGQLVNNVKTFSNGAKNDYNYGM